MPRASRSTSRGRAAPKSPKSPAAKKTPKAKAAAAPAVAKEMAFDEGDAVMARWPGTQLFFKVKVVEFEFSGFFHPADPQGITY